MDHRDQMIGLLLEENARLRASEKTARLRPKQARRKKMTLSARVKMSQSWTPSRRAARSKQLSEYWQLERATRPSQSNGELHL